MQHSHSAAYGHRSRLIGAVMLSAAVLVVELIAGVLSNSVSLIADAGHVFADTSGLLLATAAVWVADRRPTAGRSFGLYRLEILVAALNAVLLFVIAAFVIWEGIARLREPTEVQSSLIDPGRGVRARREPRGVRPAAPWPGASASPSAGPTSRS